MNTLDKESSSPRSLERGLRLLELIGGQPEPMSYTEIQHQLDLPKMTITRLLSALCGLGFLEKVEDGRYGLGARFAALTASEPIESQLRRICWGPLNDLVQQTGNSGLIIYWNGKALECLERILHEDSVVLAPPGHIVQNPHKYPAGVFCIPESTWNDDLKKRPGQVRAEGASREWYQRELKRFRKFGYAFGNLEGRNRLAAAIYSGETIIGALVVGGTPTSLPDADMPSVGALTAETAAACSAQF